MRPPYSTSGARNINEKLNLQFNNHHSAVRQEFVTNLQVTAFTPRFSKTMNQIGYQGRLWPNRKSDMQSWSADRRYKKGDSITQIKSDHVTCRENLAILLCQNFQSFQMSSRRKFWYQILKKKFNNYRNQGLTMKHRNKWGFQTDCDVLQNY